MEVPLEMVLGENTPNYYTNKIRTHLAYIANAKKSFYIKQQFTVLKARAYLTSVATAKMTSVMALDGAASL